MQILKQKQAQTFTRPPPCWTVDVPFMKCFVRFMPDVTGLKQKVHRIFFQTSQMIWIEPNESCSSLDIVLDSFVASWMSHQCILEVTLVGQPILGGYAPVLRFLYMWFSLEFTGVPKQMVLYSFSDPKMSTTLFLSCFFRLRHNVQ